MAAFTQTSERDLWIVYSEALDFLNGLDNGEAFIV